MVPIRIKLKDFMSFKELDFDFRQFPILLLGRNLTEIESQESNGSGKSALLAAFAHCLIADSMRGSEERDVDLIRFDQEKAEETLEIYCPIRKESLIINRVIPVKGSSKLSLTRLVGEEKTPVEIQFSTVRDGNKMILDWLDMNVEDIKNYFIVTKENHKSFFASSNTDKLKLIGRFSKSDILDDLKPIVEEDVKIEGSKLSDLNSQRDKLCGKNEVHEEALEKELSRNFKEEKALRIKNVKEKIQKQKDNIVIAEEGVENGKNYIKQLQEEIKTLQTSLEKTKDSLKDLDKGENFEECFNIIDSETQKLKDKKSNKEKQVDDLSDKIKGYNRLLGKIDLDLAGVVECPKCHHKFNPSKEEVVVDEKIKEQTKLQQSVITARADVETIEKSIETIQKKISIFNSERKSVEEEQREVREKLRNIQKKVEEIETSINTKESTIVRSKTKISEYKEIIEERNETIKDLKKEIEEIKKEEIVSQEKDLRLLIDKNLEDIDKLEKQIEEVNDKIFDKNQWINRFKEFKMYLAIEQVKVIQQNANRFLREMKSDIRIQIEAFKPLANGSMKEEITPFCVRDKTRRFSSYSGGERGRMMMAMILAFQYMINSTNKYGGLNFLYLDEVLDSVDGKGLICVLKSLSEFNFPIILVSHVSNIEAGRDILTVEKVNGISSIK